MSTMTPENIHIVVNEIVEFINENKDLFPDEVVQEMIDISQSQTGQTTGQQTSIVGQLLLLLGNGSPDKGNREILGDIIKNIKENPICQQEDCTGLENFNKLAIRTISLLIKPTITPDDTKSTFIKFSMFIGFVLIIIIMKKSGIISGGGSKSKSPVSKKSHKKENPMDYYVAKHIQLGGTLNNDKEIQTFIKKSYKKYPELKNTVIEMYTI